MSRLAFSAVVGQDQAKRALLMAAARPGLAGVLLRGDKGSAKTTLARGLAALLPGDAPFVELPLGATEERVIGSLDLAELLGNAQSRLRPGLLAAAHGGVLYVDEVNLLADHLVDALLDVAVSGVNRVERDGLSHSHPARFVLVASMNPEEGELRPQLLDRFGVAVDLVAPALVADRAEAVRRQLAAESGAAEADRAYAQADDELRQRLAGVPAQQLVVADDVIEVAARLALEVGAEGLRADLMLCRAAEAVAVLEGRAAVEVDDLRAVAEMVLAHRRRRRPFDEPGIAPDELDQAWQAATDETPPAPSSSGPAGSDREDRDDPGAAQRLELPAERGAASAPGRAGGFAVAEGPRGRYVREQAYEDGGPIDARATAVALASRRAVAGESATGVEGGDLRGARREQRVASLVIFVVDASTSMGVDSRMAATKAAVLGLLGDAYRRRGRVALVTFRGESAEVVLRPTASVEVAKARLVELSTGGRTPLAAGIDAASDLACAAAGDSADCVVVLVTDGRATDGGDDAVLEARAAADRLRQTGARIVVLDTETGPTRLGLARELAEAAGADLLPLQEPEALERVVRSL